MHPLLLLLAESAFWAALVLTTLPVGTPDSADPTSGRQGGVRDRRGHDDRGDEAKERPGSLADLERDLRASRPETRRSVVRKLAALGQRKAWDLVLQVLSDADPMVADEAQVVLGSITDSKLAADLLGPSGLRANDDWVRLRVAEAFGRMPIEIDAEALARGLVHGDAREGETNRAILWSMERLARAKRLGGDASKAYRAAERLARSRGDPELRGAALLAMNAIDPLEAHAAVAEWLEEGDGALRCAALVAVATWTEQECLKTSERLLDDPDPRVRAQAIENLEAQSSRAAMLALVHRMGIEPRGRLKWGIQAYLRARSGEDFGLDAGKWTAWAQKIEGRLATGEGRGLRLLPVPQTNVSFAGMNLVSDRVCFLIDFSGSTWQTKVGEKTRKQVLDAKLREALEALPPGTGFNVMPYTNDPIPWEKRLQASDKSSVKRAIDFFERCNQSGRGNFFDAALLALQDPEVDTILVLTDGVPTGGHRWNLELMVELLVERDRFRKVAFDSVLVDAPWSKRKLWEDLARRTGGRSVVAELE